jgi:hypothetical protein
MGSEIGALLQPARPICTAATRVWLPKAGARERGPYTNGDGQPRISLQYPGNACSLGGSANGARVALSEGGVVALQILSTEPESET